MRALIKITKIRTPVPEILLLNLRLLLNSDRNKLYKTSFVTWIQKMEKMVTSEMNGVITEKPVIMRLPSGFQDHHSVHENLSSTPTNRRAPGINQILSRNISSARSQRTSPRLVPLHPITSNADAASIRLSVRQAAPNQDILSNSISDIHNDQPLRVFKHQPKVLQSAHLPSVFTNEKPRAMHSNSIEHNGHFANKMQPRHPPEFAELVPHSSRTRETARRIHLKNQPVWKADDHSANSASNNSHSTDSNSKKHIAIFKKMITKFSVSSIPAIENIPQRAVKAIHLFEQIKNQSPKSKPRISLSDMITLKKVQTQDQGITKRMLHVPTLSVYDVQVCFYLVCKYIANLLGGANQSERRFQGMGVQMESEL